ncbi:hypothetical protein P691DRAFT_785567 [Macrolepiota fuliginosa MF-IS2]|uniref:Uncharacterized protein n=1 Tax=Macrolepiota fuliginosa MF-IS2 TaxID=1400762 RepID=A0A9P5X9D4_9AGAR|nr:hypothetical protein P691DRAFT_785567 [Macrolepiota fuliginosa MF-IS2]
MAVAPGRYAITWGADGINVGRMAVDEPDTMGPKPVVIGPDAAPLWVVGGMSDGRSVLATRNTLVGSIDGYLFGLLQDPTYAPDWEIVGADGGHRIRVPGTNTVWTVPAGTPPRPIVLAENIGGAGQVFNFIPAN